MAGVSNFLRAMLSPPVSTNALKVALVVGTILNLINQGNALWHGASVDWLRVGLNFLVPFLVSSYSGARVRCSN